MERSKGRRRSSARWSPSARSPFRGRQSHSAARRRSDDVRRRDAAGSVDLRAWRPTYRLQPHRDGGRALAVPALARWAAKGPRDAQLYSYRARSRAGVPALQALGIAAGLQAAGVAAPTANHPSDWRWWPCVGATALLTWLADAVNAKGVGDGLVLLFAASLALRFPALAANLLRLKVFLPAEVLASLLVLTALSVAVLVALAAGNRKRTLDPWSLLLACRSLRRSEDRPAARCGLRPRTCALTVRVLAVGALFAIAALGALKSTHAPGPAGVPASVRRIRRLGRLGADRPPDAGGGVFDLSSASASSSASLLP